MKKVKKKKKKLVPYHSEKITILISFKKIIKENVISVTAKRITFKVA